MARDNLQRIAGINAEVERLLNVQGVTRYAQIAEWTPSDVARFDRLLGFEGRIARENWIEQAQILGQGRRDGLLARDEPPRDARHSDRPLLADAIRLRARGDRHPAAAPAAVTASLPQPVRRRCRNAAAGGGSRRAALGPLGGLSLHPMHPALPGARRDDLKRIRGVGVLIEKKLNALGVTRYDQVANWSAADIERYSEKLDFKGRIERENWVEQARILSAGGQTEFSQRVDRGEVDTSKPKV